MKLKATRILIPFVCIGFLMSGCDSGVFDSEFTYSVVRQPASTDRDAVSFSGQDSIGANSVPAERPADSSASSGSSSQSQFAFTASADPNGVTVTGCLFSSPSVTVPAVLDGMAVTGIAANAFGDGIERVSLPASAVRISPRAFDSGSQIRSIEVAADNPNYSSSDGMLFDKSGAKLIRCPIGREGTVTVPNGVTDMEAMAFSGCCHVGEILLPDGLTAIGDTAFAGCKELTAITVPASVSSMGISVFSQCYGLRDVYVDKNAASSWSDDWLPPAGCRVHRT